MRFFIIYRNFVFIYIFKNCISDILKNIRLKPNVLVVSISHGAATEIANGESVFNIGDVVILVTNGRQVLRQLNDIFA